MCFSVLNLYRAFGFYNSSTIGSQDLKETSRIKSRFIHATRGGWEQLPLLKDQLLESQEKLLKAYKELLALEEEEKVREAALPWSRLERPRGRQWRRPCC